MSFLDEVGERAKARGLGTSRRERDGLDELCVVVTRGSAQTVLCISENSWSVDARSPLAMLAESIFRDLVMP